jgi:hypothetical protein
LYPAVNYFASYPIGVPDVFIPKDVDVNWTKPEDIVYIGLYKVRIIPPRNLYLPVVPMRVCGKDPRLLFSLCRLCSLSNSTQCFHNDKQRAWTSTITSIELKEALQQGYRITKCYRIWSYSCSAVLFRDYVKTFMKIKVEASGFPSNIVTEDDKHQWKKEYKSRLDIDININNVSLNPGLRHMAKYAFIY